MSSLFDDPIYVGLAAFIGGLLVARIFGRWNSRAKDEESTAADRRLRSLEADLRVTNKNLKKSEETLEATQEKFKSVNASLVDIQTSLDARTKELEATRDSLRAECQKTQALRQDLTGRAEETIRAEVHARQVEVELSVLKAGETAIHEQADHPDDDRSELSGRLRQLENEFLAADTREQDENEEESALEERLADF